ncbi:MAG: beta strand repeat-containing protein [Gemmataceae bacterium]
MALFRFGRGAKRSARPEAALFARARLRLDTFEDRVVPATFTIPNGDIAALRNAITASNSNNEPDVIDLATNGVYNFTDAAVTGSALPVITPDTADSANTLTINGNHSTFNRTGTVFVRFITADSSTTPPVLFINDLTMMNGVSTTSGGAVFLGGTSATLTNVRLTNNQGNNAGALASVSSTNVELTLVNCEIDNNSVTGGTSGIGGGVAVQGTVTLKFTGINVHNNSSQYFGGGLWIQGANLDISKSTIRGNTAPTGLSGGGGIFISGNLTMDQTQIADNSAVVGGGGIYTTGDVTITNSSLTGNTATDPASGGGGLFIGGNFVVDNATFDRNRAGNGAAITMSNGSINGTVTHSTITRNVIFGNPGEGGGIFVNANATLNLGGSIVAQNTIEGSASLALGPDIFGHVNSLGYNIIGATDGATITGSTTGNKTGTQAAPLDPLLSDLGNFGGTTLTRSLLPGSPALDAGDPNFLPPPDFDQRGAGFPRKIGSAIDIGALEGSQVDLSIVKTDNVNSQVPGDKITYFITVTNNGPQDANGAVVHDAVVAQLTNVKWTASFTGGSTGNPSGSGTILETVNIPVNGTITYTLTGTIDPSATGKLINTAFIDPPGGFADPVPGDNSSTDTDILTPVADGFVTNVLSGNPTAGGSVIYTITVGNNGPSTVGNLRLQDFFPTVFSSITWDSQASGGASGNSGFGTGNIDQFLTLRPGATVVYTVTASINADATGGPIVDTAFITPPDTVNDPDTSNNSATASSTLIVGRQIVAIGADAGTMPVVKIYNPLSGSLRSSIFAYNQGFRGGVRVAVGDFNGDGTQDIVTAPGAGGGPHIRVFDGTNGVVLWEFFAYDAGFSGGVYVAVGDVNGDGQADIITGAGAGGGPHVRVFDGATRSLMAGPVGEFFAYDSRFSGGVRVAAGDVNGDGTADIITGAGKGGGPHVEVFSGVDRSLLAGFFAYDPKFTGGIYVTAGDFNGDGNADIVTGAGEGGGPHVRFFDGATGFLFREFFAYPASSGGIGTNSIWTSGVRVGAVADVTGDGVADLYVGPGSGQRSNVRLFSGANLGLARETQVFDPTFLGGVFVGGA